MGKITIRRAEDTAFVRTADVATEENKARYGAGELTSSNRQIMPLSDESLQLFEVELEPNTKIQPHAHSAAEIILVSAGEIMVGAKSCPPGTAIYVDGDTLYGFKAGPEGCRFYNFRGVPKAEYITKEELLARRRTNADASA